MRNPLTMPAWSPYAAGAAIGMLSWFAFATANQPLGITTPFEHTAALAGQAALPGIEASNPYYADQRSSGKSPKIGWEAMLVVGVFAGAWLSAWLSGTRTTESVPPLWRQRFGGNPTTRLVAAFAGAALMMFGARLAQGCTSGHGISGALQLAVSSWAFVAVFFSVSIVSALLLFGKEGRHV